jgi:hypothetical protein
MTWNKRSAPRASQGQVTIQIRGGNLPEFTDIGCLVGDLNLIRSWANNASDDNDNWCINQTGSVSVAQFVAGTITGTSSITIEAMLADAAYQYLRQNGRAEFDIRFILEDGFGPTTTETLEYRITKTSDDLTIRGGRGQTTQFSFDFQINEIINESITTGPPVLSLDLGAPSGPFYNAVW